MKPKRRNLGPVFKRVVECFDSYAHFASMAGTSRAVVDYWLKTGYIPQDHALNVSLACAAVGGNVSALEILHETQRVKPRVSEARAAAKRRLQEAAGVDPAPAEGGA